MKNKDKCVPQVEDPRIARLVDGRILIGRDLGITTIQVCILFSALIGGGNSAFYTHIKYFS